MRSTSTILYIPPFAHENAKTLADLLAAKAEGLSSPFTLIQSSIKPKGLERGTLIVTDQLTRFGRTLYEVLTWLCKALERDCEIWIPGELDLRRSTLDFEVQFRLIHLLGTVSKSARSIAIREGIYVRRLRGGTIGRNPVSDEVRAQVIAAFAFTPSIRGVERLLKARGIQVSRSSISQIVKAAQTKAQKEIA